MEYLLVFIGGAFGACARYFLGHLIAKRSKRIVLGTLIVNILGAFLLGIVCKINLENNLYFLFADGFLAAFTTFSTFMYEGFNLFREKRILNAFFYIIISFVLGLTGFFIGYFIF